MSLEVQCSYKGILKKNFKKNTFYLFFLFISIMNYAQSVDIESKITFINGKEINSKIRFRTSFIYENSIYETSITQKNIILINDNDKKEKIQSAEVKKIEFKDLKGKQRIFQRPTDKFIFLCELIYDGKILKWYKSYSENNFDHSDIVSDILINDKEIYQVFNILTNNKKRLKEITSDKPELLPIIEKFNFNRKADECFKEVVEIYNQ